MIYAGAGDRNRAAAFVRRPAAPRRASRSGSAILSAPSAVRWRLHLRRDVRCTGSVTGFKSCAFSLKVIARA